MRVYGISEPAVDHLPQSDPTILAAHAGNQQRLSNSFFTRRTIARRNGRPCCVVPSAGPAPRPGLDVTVTRGAVSRGSGNAIRTHVGRTFDLSVRRVRRGRARWMGETVGFWDGTRSSRGPPTSGVVHPFQLEYPISCKRSRLTPRSDRRASCSQHEAVLRRGRAAHDPHVFLPRRGSTRCPDNLTHCNQTLFVVNGRATPLVPGTVIPYRVEGSLRPAVGGRVGGELRTGYAAAPGRGHLRLRTRMSIAWRRYHASPNTISHCPRRGPMIDRVARLRAPVT